MTCLATVQQALQRVQQHHCIARAVHVVKADPRCVDMRSPEPRRQVARNELSGARAAHTCTISIGGMA